MEELLTKYFTGEITAYEKKLLFQAMDTDMALREEFYALQNAIAITGCLKGEEDRSIGETGYKKFSGRLLKYRLGKWMLHSCKYAALVCLVAVGAYFLTRYQLMEELGEHYTEISAPSGQRVKVNLPDGTVAWLSPCSTLRYAASFNDKNRDVELKGATFFDVAHNADKPFRILTGTYQITVLGTRFNVMAYPESKRFEIDLVEGSVQVNNANDPTDQLILCPHEQAILRNNRLWRQASEFDNEEYLKNGIVSFKSRPFGEILDNVALWQEVRFTVEKDVDIQKSVTGKFRQSDSLESILRVLQSIADFRYKIIDEKHVTIYR